ncbi:hypothetical protein LZ30DRAFT_382505 [Colletotrichum cereale]|nr:hypothetical protein LZ30DRAFT_382505 [Colletotrichum cereale]
MLGYPLDDGCSPLDPVLRFLRAIDSLRPAVFRCGLPRSVCRGSDSTSTGRMCLCKTCHVSTSRQLATDRTESSIQRKHDTFGPCSLQSGTVHTPVRSRPPSQPSTRPWSSGQTHLPPHKVPRWLEPISPSSTHYHRISTRHVAEQGGASPSLIALRSSR